MRKESVDIDANYIVRVIVRDIPGQVETVERLFEEARSGKVDVSIATVALFEAYHTLTSSYSRDEGEARDSIADIVDSVPVAVENADVFWEAVSLSRASGNKDLCDCYVAAYAKMRGNNLLTFDKALTKMFGRM